ncbi:MAG: hypothetical protein SWX82_11405 [Cyanobacteriota bacterium]|nr:hypothetical protein [Cyanobacteriota bacterium]
MSIASINRSSILCSTQEKVRRNREAIERPSTFSVISYQLSVISYQLSVISYQLSVKSL